MEKWIEVFKDKIPTGKYQTKMINGEESGLIIELENTFSIVRITFGEVKAIRMLDEGIVLNGVYSNTEIAKYKCNNFKNVIYQVMEGEFGNYIKNACGDIAEYLDLKHYILISMSYNIDIISEWEPSLEIIEK